MCSSDLAEIRGAYQSKVAQYHPDKLEKLNENLRRLAENEVRAIDSAYLKLIENLDVVRAHEPAVSSTGLMLVMRNLYGRVRSNW